MSKSRNKPLCLAARIALPMAMAWVGIPAVISTAAPSDSFQWNASRHQVTAEAFLKNNQMPEFERELKALKSLAPADPITRGLELRGLEVQGKWAQIIELTSSAPEASVETSLLRAKAFLALGKQQQAEKILSKLATSAEANAEMGRGYWEIRGDVAVKKGERDAERYYRRALEIEPENFSATMKLAEELSRKGGAEEASELLFPLTEKIDATEAVKAKYISYLERAGLLSKAGQTLQAWRALKPGLRWQDLAYADLLDKVGEEKAAAAIRLQWKPEGREVGPRTVSVQKGDTLQSLSERIYGTTKKWKIIRDQNSSLLANGNQIFPGMKLRLPRDEEDEVEREQALAIRSIPAETPGETRAEAPVEAPVEAEVREEVVVGIEAPARSRASGFLSLSAGFSLAGNSLKGSGFQGKASPDIGLTQGIEGTYFFSPVWGLSASLAQASFTYASLGGMSPSSLAVHEQNMQFGGAIAVGGVAPESGWSKNLVLGLGWQTRKRDATATTPNVLVSAYRAAGLGFSLATEDQIFRQLSTRARAKLFFPSKFTERNTNTGRFSSARGLELELLLLFPLSSQVSASVGVVYENFRANFLDAGSRGTSSATEVSSEWLVPFGLVWKF